MDEIFTALCAVTYYDSLENENSVDYIAITGLTTYAEAMRQIEAYYAQDLLSVNITLSAQPFCPLTKTQYNTLMEDTI
jgi:hypothetical protein